MSKLQRHPPFGWIPPDRELYDGWGERQCETCRLWFSVPPEACKENGKRETNCPYCAVFDGRITIKEFMQRKALGCSGKVACSFCPLPVLFKPKPEFDCVPLGRVRR